MTITVCQVNKFKVRFFFKVQDITEAKNNLEDNLEYKVLREKLYQTVLMCTWVLR